MDKWMSVFRHACVACLCMMATVAWSAGPELMATLSVMGYGYKVKVTVNGSDVGVEGGKSEGRRLFNKDHEMAAKAPPAMRARNFVLVPGRNEVVVEYTKLDPKSQDELEVTLEAAEYPQPVLRLLSKSRASDKVAVSVDIADKPPAGFKPIALEPK